MILIVSQIERTKQTKQKSKQNEQFEQTNLDVVYCMYVKFAFPRTDDFSLVAAQAAAWAAFRDMANFGGPFIDRSSSSNVLVRSSTVSIIVVFSVAKEVNQIFTMILVIVIRMWPI